MIGLFKRRMICWSVSIGIVLLLIGTSLAQEVNLISQQKDESNDQSRGTYTFNPIDDSYVGWPDDINGDLPVIALRNGSTNDYWLCAGCVKFDISGIPSNASIVSASLSLYYYGHSYSNPAGHPIVVHRFNGDWNEDTISRNFMPAWNSEISAQTALPSSEGFWLTWDVTSDVQDFVSGALSNYGWIIKDEYYWSGANIPSPFLHSKEFGSLIPYLEIELSDNNTSPAVPQISGPTEGLPGNLYSYNFISTDPDSDLIYYWIEWDDGDTTGWLGPYNSGQTLTLSHSWDNPETYTIQAKAKDTHGAESSWGTYLVNIINNPPTAPQITGPTNGHPGNIYDYTMVSTDPDQNPIYYLIDWDDGDTTDWLGPYNSGQPITVSHAWTDPGTYTIQAKAKDTYGAEGNWGTYLVTMINNPPATPQITGPANGTNGHSCYYTLNCIDPDGDQIYYWIEWGDGYTNEWNGPYDSGQSVIFSHSWDTPGVYIISVQSKDDYGAESGWGTFVMNIGSNPPETPQITGAVNGTPGDAYDYTFITSDEDGNLFYFWIDWGDGQTNQWIGPYNSGQVVTLPHTWSEKGTYVIKAKAKDTYGAESGWGTFTVTMPFSKNFVRPHFLEWLFERYPHIFPILRHLLGF
jgi:hypothetical protein